MMTYIQSIDSPLGTVSISATDQGICSVYFRESEHREQASQHTRDCAQQLQEYFAGQRQQFDLALDVQGTDFQQQVWQALQQIPYGQVASYRDIANSIGNPKAVRAVGAANGKNPVSIIVPCHRVIGANGSLTGYAGGLERKQHLLQLEAKALFSRA